MKVADMNELMDRIEDFGFSSITLRACGEECYEAAVGSDTKLRAVGGSREAALNNLLGKLLEDADSLFIT
jgi:hypothetical protein